MPTKIGFVGLGRMGKPIAANLLAAGFDVMVFDVREEPLRELAQLGAARAASLKDVARHSEIVALAVVDDAQVESVVLSQDGLLQDGKRGSVLVIHSTVMPATVHKLARAGSQRDVEIVDAPVSGGEDGARERQLCYMVGGEKEIVERCRPVMEASAAHIFHMGGLGSGATAKMILQVVVCINMLGAHEAELLAQKSGLDFAALQKVLHVSSGQSFVSDHWLERFKRPQDPLPIRQRRTEVFAESLSPALRTASDQGFSLPGASLVQQLLRRIMGFGDRGPA
ncbi:MAG TPA: NAD(P)-dependent oxidoreductase [Candidatus Acidoferrales bacterium]|nr:NAD(P)-dependent oxidoreductase [Candidatus Acidoferrales bacterium]